MNEKRKQLRIRWGGKLQAFEPASGRLLVSDGRLNNLGRNGFAFISEEQLNRGITYDFTIHIQIRTLRLKGTVIHARNEMAYFFYGARIDSISLFNRGKWNRILCSQSKKHERSFLLQSLIAGGIAAMIAKLIFGVGWGGVVIAFVLSALLFFTLLPF